MTLAEVMTFVIVPAGLCIVVVLIAVEAWPGRLIVVSRPPTVVTRVCVTVLVCVPAGLDTVDVRPGRLIVLSLPPTVEVRVAVTTFVIVPAGLVTVLVVVRAGPWTVEVLTIVAPCPGRVMVAGLPPTVVVLVDVNVLVTVNPPRDTVLVWPGRDTVAARPGTDRVLTFVITLVTT